MWIAVGGTGLEEVDVLCLLKLQSRGNSMLVYLSPSPLSEAIFSPLQHAAAWTVLLELSDSRAKERRSAMTESLS